MSVIRTLLIDKSQEEIEAFALKYFRHNGYYNITVKEGMKFSTYSSEKPVLSPKRLNHDVLIKFFPNGEGQKVVVKFDMEKLGSYGPKTAIDKEYYEDFMAHIEAAIKDFKVRKFETEDYEKRASVYNKSFYTITVIIMGLYVLSVIFLRDIIEMHFLFSAYLIAQGLIVYYVNYKEKKKATLERS